MKLVLCAAVSFAVMGCVDDVSTGGGQLDGIEPERLNGPVPEIETHLTQYDFPPDRLSKPFDRSSGDHFLDALAQVIDATTACQKHHCKVVWERWGSFEDINVYLNDAPLCQVARDPDTGTVGWTNCY